MSWNIKTPGDYINGPLTVAGAAQFNSTVGIGSAATNNLSVSTSSANGGIHLNYSGSTFSLFGISNPGVINDTIFGAVSNNAVRLISNNTDRVWISSTGNVGVGNAPSAWSSMLGIQVRGASFACDASIHRGRLLTNAFYDGANYKYIQTNFGLMYAQNSLDGSHVWLTAASGSAGANISTFNQMFGINSNGAVSLFGGNASANGVGIAFPSAQSASTDANTLDDYEEGTWTGTLQGSSTNPTTPVTATGKYTKIGRQVTIQISFDTVNTTGASGGVRVSGLPFASADTSFGVLQADQGVAFTGTIGAYIGSGGTVVFASATASSAARTDGTHNAGTGRFFWINMTYNV